MTEGHVLLNAIAKAELAYHVKNDCFVYDYSGAGNGIGKGRYLDIDSSGNKYFTYWEAEPRNNHVTVNVNAQNPINKVAKADDDGDTDDNDDNDEYDYVNIFAEYMSPKGLIVLRMEVCSNGGCSDIEQAEREQYIR